MRIETVDDAVGFLFPDGNPHWRGAFFDDTDLARPLIHVYFSDAEQERLEQYEVDPRCAQGLRLLGFIERLEENGPRRLWRASEEGRCAYERILEMRLGANSTTR